jgi:hypothetical protein
VPTVAPATESFVSPAPLVQPGVGSALTVAPPADSSIAVPRVSSPVIADVLVALPPGGTTPLPPPASGSLAGFGVRVADGGVDGACVTHGDAAQTQLSDAAGGEVADERGESSTVADVVSVRDAGWRPWQPRTNELATARVMATFMGRASSDHEASHAPIASPLRWSA